MFIMWTVPSYKGKENEPLKLTPLDVINRVKELVYNTEKNGTRVISEPRGRTVFMFFATWGRHRPLRKPGSG
jgi:hypothetical protein